jgi:hypothetical protein
VLHATQPSPSPTHTPAPKYKPVPTGLPHGPDRLSQVPVLVSKAKDEGLLKMWIMSEKKPKVPYVSAFLRLVFPRALVSAKTAAFMDLFVNLVKDSLHNELFMATEAGLKVRISNADDGVGMHFEGLGHAIPLLMYVRFSSGVLLVCWSVYVYVCMSGLGGLGWGCICVAVCCWLLG